MEININKLFKLFLLLGNKNPNPGIKIIKVPFYTKGKSGFL